MKNESYIKQAFKNYNANKKRLRELSLFESVRAVDYTKITIKHSRQGVESSMIKELDDRRDLERKIELVDRVLEYYVIKEKAVADGKAAFFRFRVIKGMSFTRSAIECGVSQSTAVNWWKDILQTAAAVMLVFNL